MASLMHGVSTTGTIDKSGPQRKNLSSIIRGFKSAVTIDIRKINSDFGWQPRFHDHLIRDNKSLNNIRQYIRDNPKNWADDELNPDIILLDMRMPGIDGLQVLTMLRDKNESLPIVMLTTSTEEIIRSFGFLKLI